MEHGRRKGITMDGHNKCNDRGGGAGGRKFKIRPKYMENGSEVSSNRKGIGGSGKRG